VRGPNPGPRSPERCTPGAVRATVEIWARH
jgi:hypothetical protein